MTQQVTDRQLAASKVACVLGVAVLALCCCRPVLAYIDPGTGGAIFSGLAPIIGLIGVVIIGALGFARTYVRAGLGVLWRARLALLILLLGVAAGVLVYAVSARGSDAPEDPPARQDQRPTEVGAAPAPRTVSDSGEPGLEGALRGDPPQTTNEVVAFIEARKREFRPAEPFRLFAAGQSPDIARAKCQLARASRSCFAFDASGAVETSVVPGRPGRLVFHVAAQFEPESSCRAVSFRLSVAPEGGSPVVAARRDWTAAAAEPRWERIVVDLAQYAGTDVGLRFEAELAGPGARCLVSDPRLAGAPGGGRPNVVVVSIESTRRDHVSLYGYGTATTPFLDRLAAQAITFDEAYSQSCWTRPSVASVLTGLYPSQHGAVVMFDRLHSNAVLLPEVLRDAGYCTAAFVSGRPVADPVFNYDQGFDVFVDAVPRFPQAVGGLREWLVEEEPGPFFAFLHVQEPHEPYDARGQYRDFFDRGYDGRLKGERWLWKHSLKEMTLTDREHRYVVARYDGGILEADAGLQGLVAMLESLGLWDNTMLVVTSDHGEELREHGDWGHGRNLYPEKLRIPLVIRLPGGATGGRRVTGLASHIDIAPTVLSVAGVAPSEHLPGVDLLSGGPDSGTTGRRYHFAEYWTLAGQIRDLGHFSVIGGGLQLIRRQRSAGGYEDELYDLEKDPDGTVNVADREPEALRTLRDLLDARYGTAGYTIALNGATGSPHELAGTVRSEGSVKPPERIRLEGPDAVEVAADGREIRFKCFVEGDDDVLRFQTEPPGCPVEVEIRLDGEPIAPELVSVGPLGARPGRLPLAVPAGRCAADADLVDARSYQVGKGPRAYLWRTGVAVTSDEESVRPDEAMLQDLRDLGYL